MNAAHPESIPSLLLLGGLAVGLVLIAWYVIELAVRRGWAPTKSAAMYLLGTVATVIAVRFVFAPRSFYGRNLTSPLQKCGEEGMGDGTGCWLTTPFVGAAGQWIIVGIIIAAFYFMGWWFLYRNHKRRVMQALDPAIAAGPLIPRSFAVMTIAVTLAIVAGGIFILSLPLLSAFVGGEYGTYFQYVFRTGWCIAIAGGLVLAVVTADRAFVSATERAVALRDASVLASFFVFGAILILSFNALWIVFMIALTSSFPLQFSWTNK